MRPQGAKAWSQIRTSGLSSVRPVEILRALWGEGDCEVKSLVMPCDGAIPGVTEGRFVEGPGRVTAQGAVGQKVELPIELEELLEQLSLSIGCMPKQRRRAAEMCCVKHWKSIRH